MSRAPRLSPITELQWDHIFGILDGACYGSNATQVAWTWLSSNGCVMKLSTFYERLRKERRARIEKAAAGAAEAAAAATAVEPMRDSVPLVGSSFVQEGATEPPSAHGGLAAPPARTDVDGEPCAPHDVGQLTALTDASAGLAPAAVKRPVPVSFDDPGGAAKASRAEGAGSVSPGGNADESVERARCLHGTHPRNT
jgi:hypothetical protein